jgi:hypothetical protein
MKEFDFKSVGKRMPYNVPEGFFDVAKEQAKCVALAGAGAKRPAIYKYAVAVAAVVMACGVVLWLDDYLSPQRQYDRLLAEVSTEVLWDYTCEYSIDNESDIFY